MARAEDFYRGFKRVGLIGLSLAGCDAAIRKGILKYRGNTCRWLFHDFGHRADDLAHSLKEKRAFACDGFIGHVGNRDVDRLLSRIGKPVVNLSGAYQVEKWRTHRIDDRAIGVFAAEHFLGLGYRHFIYFGMDTLLFARERWRGFADRLRGEARFLARVHDRRTEVVLPVPDRKPLVSTVQWIRDLPKPLAGFCPWDASAQDVFELLHTQVRIPEELALLGVDNNEVVCHMSGVPLSSIAWPAEKLGYLAAEHLAALLRGRPAPALLVLPPERVVVRASSDLVAVEDPVVARALAWMRRHAADRTPLKVLLGELPVSARGFTDRFRAVVGRSPRDELFRLRVELARTRLLTTNQTMFRIAAECGFADTERLTTTFKRHTGMTPAAYRRQHRI